MAMAGLGQIILSAKELGDIINSLAVAQALFCVDDVVQAFTIIERLEIELREMREAIGERPIM